MVHVPTERGLCLIQNYSIDENNDCDIEVYPTDTVDHLLQKVCQRYHYSVSDFQLVYKQWTLGSSNKDTQLSKIGLRFSRNEKNILRIEYIKESASDFKSHNFAADFLNNNNNFEGANIFCGDDDVTISNNNSIEETNDCDSDWDESVSNCKKTVNKENKMPPLVGPFPRPQRSTAVSGDFGECSNNYNSSNDSVGFVGLVNQAMTCYLNSLLQSLFMTPEFRNAVYNWEYKSVPEKKTKCIAYQLQKLFLKLQTSNKTAVHTNDLTSSFGWTSNEAWQQHDIQELCRVMFEALEKKFANTPQADLINRLYQGKMLDCIKCEECKNVKSREDIFLDIPLQVRQFGSTKSFTTIQESLGDFIRPELLNGTNQYFCEKCNKKCDAKKALIFQKFPYILTLHLKRFDYDFATSNRIKINDEIIFPYRLDLSAFVGDDEKILNGDTVTNGVTNHHNHVDFCNGDGDFAVENSSPESNDDNCHMEGVSQSEESNLYDLFSIMIHSGSANGGHYFVYIRNFENNQWYSFNDQTVSKITEDDIQRVYGSPSRLPYSFSTSNGNAYMLFYRRVCPDNAAFLCENEFPSHLKQVMAEIRKSEETHYNSDNDLQIAFYNDPSSNSQFMCKTCYCKLNDTFQSKTISFTTNSTISQIKKLASKAFDIDRFNTSGPVRLVAFDPSTKKMLYSFDKLEYDMFEHLQDDGKLEDDQVVFFLEHYEKKSQKFEPLRPLSVSRYVKIVHLEHSCIQTQKNLESNEVITYVKDYLRMGHIGIYCMNRHEPMTSNFFIQSDLDVEAITNKDNIVLFFYERECDQQYIQQLCHQLDNCVTFSVKIQSCSEDELAKKSIPCLNYDKNLKNTNGYQNGDNKENVQTNGHDKDASTNYYIRVYYEGDKCGSEDEKTYKVVADKKILVAKLKSELEYYVNVPMKYYKIIRDRDECKDGDTLSDVILFNNDNLAVGIDRLRAIDEITTRVYYLDFSVEAKFVYICDWFMKIDETIGDVKSQILNKFLDLKDKYPGLCAENCRVLKKTYKNVTQVYLDHEKVGTDDLNLPNNCEICLQKMLSAPPETITKSKQVLVQACQWRPSMADFGSFNDLIVDLEENRADLLAGIRRKLEQISGIPSDNIEISAGNITTKLKISAMINKKWSNSDQKQFSDMLDSCDSNGVCIMFYKDKNEEEKEISEQQLDEIRKKESTGKFRTNINSRKDKSLRIHVDT